MLSTVIETKELLQTVVASLVAGIGITAAFAILIFGATRSADLMRDDQPVAATAFGALAVIALLVVTGGIVQGVIVMTQK